MKTQMKFQKRLCLAMLILGALSVVYALFYCTGVLAGFSTTLLSSTSRGYYANPNFEAGGQLYLDVQSFNNLLLYMGIVLVLAAVVLYITGTQSRRNYYISNYVASVVVAVIFIAISAVLLIMNASYMSQAIEVINDTDAMAYYQTLADTYSYVTYSESIVMFIVGFVLYIVNIIAAIVLILNMIWKNKLMKGEKALLAQGLAKEVA